MVDPAPNLRGPRQPGGQNATRSGSRASILVAITVAIAALACVLPACGNQAPPPTVQKRDVAAPPDIVNEGLDNDDPYVRAEVAKLLEHGSDELRKNLNVLIDDGDPMVSLVAAGAMLRNHPTHEAASALIATRVTDVDTPVRLASVHIARHAPFDKQVDILKDAMRASGTPSLRHLAIREFVNLLNSPKVPSAKQARPLEQQMVTWATDPDTEVAGIALGYVLGNTRLVKDAADLKKTLHALVRSTEPLDQKRALRILIVAGDKDLDSVAFDVLAASEGTEDTELRDLAVIAVGVGGDANRIQDLEKIAQQEKNKELQLFALTALVGLKAPGSAIVLTQALSHPDPEVRRHVLDGLLATKRKVQIPEDILRAEEVDIRVRGLKMLHRRGGKRFGKVVTQKLEVETFRTPLLHGLAAWARESKPPAGGGAGLPWLERLRPQLEDFALRLGKDPELGAAVWTLLAYLDGPGAVLNRWVEMSWDARYFVLEAALKGRVKNDAFGRALESPYYAVRLLGAIGS